MYLLIIVGRPYGGTAILYEKSIANRVSLVQANNSRVIGITLSTKYGPVLVLSVYMPTNYHDDESLEKYVETCGEITALITECDAVEYIIAGDLNCNVGSRFYGHLEEFMADNRVACSDVKLLSGEFTYSNSDHTCVFWIDHVLCTKLMDNNIIEV